MTEFEEYIARLSGFFMDRISQDKRIGQTPMTLYEGGLVDQVARGEPVPEHPSTCTSAPFRCWHGKIWHKQRSGRLGPCNVAGCQCVMFVPQEPCQAMPAPRLPRGGTAPGIVVDELMLFDASDFA